MTSLLPAHSSACIIPWGRAILHPNPSVASDFASKPTPGKRLKFEFPFPVWMWQCIATWCRRGVIGSLAVITFDPLV